MNKKRLLIVTLISLFSSHITHAMVPANASLVTREMVAQDQPHELDKSFKQEKIYVDITHHPGENLLLFSRSAKMFDWLMYNDFKMMSLQDYQRRAVEVLPAAIFHLLELPSPAKSAEKHIQTILNCEGDPNLANVDGETLFFHAVKLNLTFLAMRLVEKGANPLRRPKNYSPLHYAVINNNSTLVDFLLKHGADINELSISHEPPLHFSQSEDMAEFLIERGADISIKSTQGNGFMETICANKFAKLAKKYFSSINLPMQHRKTPGNLLNEDLYEIDFHTAAITKQSVQELERDIAFITAQLELNIYLIEELVGLLKKLTTYQASLKQSEASEIVRQHRMRIVDATKKIERYVNVQQQREKQEKEKALLLEHNLANFGPQALLAKIFFADVPLKMLNLTGAKTVKTKITFVEVDEKNRDWIINLNFKHQNSDTTHQLLVRPIINAENKVSHFAWRTKGSVATAKKATFANSAKSQSKKTASPVTFQRLAVEFKDSNIILKGVCGFYSKTGFRPENFTWTLALSDAQQSPPEDKRQPAKATVAIPENVIQPEVARAPVHYRRIRELIGVYEGTSDSMHYVFTIAGDEMGNIVLDNHGRIVIAVTITNTKNRAVTHTTLFVKPETTIDREEVVRLIPLITSGTGPGKFIAGMTTFAGERSSNSTAKLGAKSAKKKAPRRLCFLEAFTVFPRQNNEAVRLFVKTSSGDLYLNQRTIPIVEHPVDEQIPDTTAPDARSDNLTDWADVDEEGIDATPYENDEDEEQEEEQEGIDDPADIIAAAHAPQAKSLIRKVQRQKEEPYVDWEDYGFRSSQSEVDRDARLRRLYGEKLREIAQQPIESTKTAPVRIKNETPHFVNVDEQTLSVEQPRWLNPNTRFEKCPLYQSEGSEEDNLWTGVAHVRVDGNKLQKRFPEQRIALGMKNFAGRPPFSVAGSWCSWFDSEDRNQRYFGKLVHCSYHSTFVNDLELRYVHISHQGLFFIETRSDGSVLLRKVKGDSPDEEEVFYVLRRSRTNAAMSALERAHRFINYRSAPNSHVDALGELEELENRAHDLKEALVEQTIVVGTGRQQRVVRLQSDGYVFISGRNGRFQRHGALLNVDMINHEVGFISIPYSTWGGGMRALTFKVVNADGQIVVVP